MKTFYIYKRDQINERSFYDCVGQCYNLKSAQEQIETAKKFFRKRNSDPCNMDIETLLTFNNGFVYFNKNNPKEIIALYMIIESEKNNDFEFVIQEVTNKEMDIRKDIDTL